MGLTQSPARSLELPGHSLGGSIRERGGGAFPGAGRTLLRPAISPSRAALGDWRSDWSVRRQTRFPSPPPARLWPRARSRAWSPRLRLAAIREAAAPQGLAEPPGTASPASRRPPASGRRPRPTGEKRGGRGGASSGRNPVEAPAAAEEGPAASAGARTPPPEPRRGGAAGAGVGGPASPRRRLGTFCLKPRREVGTWFRGLRCWRRPAPRLRGLCHRSAYSQQGSPAWEKCGRASDEGLVSRVREEILPRSNKKQLKSGQRTRVGISLEMCKCPLGT